MRRDLRWARLRNGLELPYVETGEPTGLPLVLLPGYAETYRSFELLLPELPPSVRALALTQRGHGGPRTLGDTYSLDALAADVASFMDAVDVDGAVVAGASSGGYVAQQLAADHPERVVGLALAGAPRTLRGIPAVERFARRLETEPDTVTASFAREFVASTVGRSVPRAFLERMIDEARAIPKPVWERTLAALSEAAPPTETASIAAPALILWGDADTYVPRADAERLARAIPDSTFIVYEGAGHALTWEEPRRMAADITRFLDENGF